MKKVKFVFLAMAVFVAVIAAGFTSAEAAAPTAKGYEFTKGAEDPLEDLPAEVLYTENLSKEKLAVTDKDVLAYMRNRIYARHGYVFKTKKWKDEFTKYDWYRPNQKFSEKLFNNFEKENIRRIQAAEKKK
jgi:hypothetical protein